MPEIYVHLAEGRTQDQKRALMQDITKAVVTHIGVDPNNVMVQIIEAPRHLKAKGGVFFSERP